MSAWAIPLAALVISVASFVVAQFEIGRRAKVDYVDQLEARIAECESDRKDLRKQVKNLSEENVELFRRLVRLENT